ncbi:MAG: hypothetical protein R3F50_02165 [Gammaproteobacteria bacterium]
MFAFLISLSMSISAAGLIYFSWRQRGKLLAASAGWILAFGSAFSWAQVLGPEIGTCYAVMIFICLVWLEVIYTMEPARGQLPASQRSLQAIHRPTASTCFRHAMIFLLSVPASGAITMLVTVALVIHLPWSLPLRLAVGIFAYPILWGAYSAWICAQGRLLKPAILSMGLLALSSLILFI